MGLASVSTGSDDSAASFLTSSFLSSSTSFSFFSREKAPNMEFLLIGLGATMGSAIFSASSASVVSLTSVGASVEAKSLLITDLS